MNWNQYWRKVKQTCLPATVGDMNYAVKKGFKNCRDKNDCVNGWSCHCGIVYSPTRFWTTNNCQAKYRNIPGVIQSCRITREKGELGWQKYGFYCADGPPPTKLIAGSNAVINSKSKSFSQATATKKYILKVPQSRGFQGCRFCEWCSA